jgi:hypothetical protein
MKVPGKTSGGPIAVARRKPQGKPNEDEAREGRISMEIVVDACGES